MLGEKALQRLTRHGLDHLPEPGGVEPVLPPLAGLGYERGVEALPYTGKRGGRSAAMNLSNDFQASVAGPARRLEVVIQQS